VELKSEEVGVVSCLVGSACWQPAACRLPTSLIKIQEGGNSPMKKTIFPYATNLTIIAGAATLA